MKIKIHSFFSAALTSLLGLLGFSGCIVRVEYGCPHADYDVTIKVVDESGKPVPGIKVTTPGQELWGEDWTDPVYSDKDGIASFQRQTYSFFEGKYYLTDVDGEDNGGQFARDSLEYDDFTLDRIEEPKKSDHWYDGVYEATAVKKLHHADDEQ